MLYLRSSRNFWLLIIVAVLCVYYLRSQIFSDSGLKHANGHQESPPKKPSLTSIHWVKTFEHFPVNTTIQLPIGKNLQIPSIQYKFPVESDGSISDRKAKLEVIKSTFQRAWDSYSRKAWMHDEVSPVSGTSDDHFNGWGAMLIDSLDTLRMMGFRQEFLDAVDSIQYVDFTTSKRSDIPVFETTIKYLGGLLSAYDISDRQHQILLDKAIELAEVLMGAFDTPNRMPFMHYLWKPTETSESQYAPKTAILAELGSMALEFTRLAQITKNSKYYDAVARITDALEQLQMKTKLPGMWPGWIDTSGCSPAPRGAICSPQGLASSPTSEEDIFTLGAYSDTAYGNLIKEYLLLGGLEPKYQTMYERARSVVKEKLIFKPMTPSNADILVSGTCVVHKARPDKAESTEFIPQNSHLKCFAGSMLALGAKIFEREDDLVLAKKLTEGCIWAYKATISGLMPEQFLHMQCPDGTASCDWDEAAWRLAAKAGDDHLPKGMTEIKQKHYLLRPEAIESIFYLYRITGDNHWRHVGWEMFLAIEKATKTEFGNSAIDDVTIEDSAKLDIMQSFWMSETLKYFWLLFSSEDMVSLDEYVFNAQAHPFKRPA